MSTIPPFPSDIDRHDFGNWLSGFVDGEGCFLLSYQLQKCPRTAFKLALRSDDSAILHLIQSFWQCGTLRLEHSGRRSPVLLFSVDRTGDNRDALVPHFTAFPLRAKKARDFLIWKEGVELVYRVSLRGRRFCTKGRQANWSHDELDTFKALFTSLKAQRVFPAV